MDFTGNYYQCKECEHITDYSDTQCYNCGSQNEIELNAKEVKQIANQSLIIRDFNKNKIGMRLLAMLELHNHFQ